LRRARTRAGSGRGVRRWRAADMPARRILARDINRRDYFMGCWYYRNMRYPDYGWNILVVKPGVGYKWVR
jgi:hypothetical protein